MSEPDAPPTPTTTPNAVTPDNKRERLTIVGVSIALLFVLGMVRPKFPFSQDRSLYIPLDEDRAFHSLGYMILPAVECVLAYYFSRAVASKLPDLEYIAYAVGYGLIVYLMYWPRGYR